MGRQRSTTAVVLQRRKEVMAMLLDGKSHTEIQDYIQSNFGVLHGQVEKDIQEAYKIIESDYTQEMQQIISKHIAMYHKHREIALQTGQVQAATQALIAIEKLKGLHKPETQVNIQNNTVTVQTEPLTVEQIKELLQQNESK